VFNEHCQEHGALKESSRSIDLTVPIKKVVARFTGSREDAAVELESFCKQHRSSSIYGRVEEEIHQNTSQIALQSLNQCLEFEKFGIQVTQTYALPRLLNIDVSFNPDRSTVRLQNVSVHNLKCIISDDSGKPKSTRTVRNWNMRRPFTIACTRAGRDENGQTRYERASVIVSLNQKSFSANLPPEDVLGYDLASENRSRFEALSAEADSLEAVRSRLEGETNELKALLKSVRVTGFRQCQGCSVPCPQHGGDRDTAAKVACGGGEVRGFQELHRGDGPTCGWRDFIFACIGGQLPQQ
jgi:hypothetical protein